MIKTIVLFLIFYYSFLSIPHIIGFISGIIKGFRTTNFFKHLDRSFGLQGTRRRECYVEICIRYWEIYKKQHIKEREWEIARGELDLSKDELLAGMDFFEDTVIVPFIDVIESQKSFGWMVTLRFSDNGQEQAFYTFVRETHKIFYQIADLQKSEVTLSMIQDPETRTKLEWKMCPKIVALIRKGMYHGVIEKLRPA